MLVKPEISAERLCNLTWANRGFPVDPVTISKALGLRVMETSLPPEVSGAIIKNAGADPIIVLEQTDSNNRKRFTCAHELGHFVYKSEQGGGDNFNYVDLRDASSRNGTEPEEIFANQFAACLLMPEREVSRLVKDGQPVTSMALWFGVSAEAMEFRLKNLRLAVSS